MEMRRPAFFGCRFSVLLKVRYKQNSCEDLDGSSQLFLCFVLHRRKGVCSRDLCKFVLLVSLDFGLLFDIAEVEIDEVFIFAALFVILQSSVELLDKLVIIFVCIHYQVILTVGVTNNR